MYQELPIQTPLGACHVFLQQGFYSGLASTTFHTHNYTEIHLLLGGTATIALEGGECVLHSGDMLVIPPRTLHACVRQEAEARHSAFQIDQDVGAHTIFPLDEAVVRCYFSEIQRAKKTGDYTVLSALIAVWCCYIAPGERVAPRPVVSDAFVIHEFFSLHYNEDVCLGDLSRELHLSERQTERLVQEHMGGNFRQTLADARIRMARQWMANSSIPLHEIAQRVGYRSYAGFWKAMKRQVTKK